MVRELARCGHSVTVLEKHVRPGGMLNQGIPAFRLPRDIVDREIEQVRRCGVEIRSGVEVGKDLTLTELLAQHDAVVLAGRNPPPQPPRPARRGDGRHPPRPRLPPGGQRTAADRAFGRGDRDRRGLHRHGLRLRGQAADQFGRHRLLPPLPPRNAPRHARRTGGVLEREGIPLEEMLAPTGYVGDAAAQEVRLASGDVLGFSPHGTWRSATVGGQPLPITADAPLLSVCDIQRGTAYAPCWERPRVTPAASAWSWARQRRC